MNPKDFSDAALVIIGHGTELNPESCAPVYQHAAELRRRKLFAQVREAFWKQDPQVQKVLPELNSPRVFLVPFFISEGYFSEQVIPRALGFRGEEAGEFCRVQPRLAQALFYCRPVGTHPSMTQVLLARARHVLEQFPFPRIPQPAELTLFLAGHGTSQTDNSRKAVERQVELIRDLKLYADVQAVFMEEDPRIGACYGLARTKHLVLVPFFTSDGLHVRADIPVLLGESEQVVQERLKHQQPTWRNPTEKHGKLVWYAPSVGTEPVMAQVILERVQEAALWPGTASQV